MLGPSDDGVVTSADDPIQFFGYHLQPDRPVRVESFDWRGNVWSPVGETRSATKTTPSDLKQDLYYWTFEEVLASRFWQPGAEGARAKVRAKTQITDGRWSDLVTVERDWGACYAAHQDATDFAEACKSDHSPEAWIQTEDYCVDYRYLDDDFVDGLTSPSFTWGCDTERIQIRLRPLLRTFDRVAVNLLVGGVNYAGESCTQRIDPSTGWNQVTCTVTTYPEVRLSGAEIAHAIGFRDAELTVVGYADDRCGGFSRMVLGRGERIHQGMTDLCRPGGDPTPDPDPTPTPGESLPDLQIELGPHDGSVTTLTVCNRGAAAVPTNDFVVRYKGQIQTEYSTVNMRSYLPASLAPGVCRSAGDAFIGRWDGTGTGSAYAEAWVDWNNDVRESNELNNYTQRRSSRF